NALTERTGSASATSALTADRFGFLLSAGTRAPSGPRRLPPRHHQSPLRLAPAPWPPDVNPAVSHPPWPVVSKRSAPPALAGPSRPRRLARLRRWRLPSLFAWAAHAAGFRAPDRPRAPAPEVRKERRERPRRRCASAG